MRPAITRRQRSTPRLPTRAARRRTSTPRLRETPRTRASPSDIRPAKSRERFLRGSCHAEPQLGPHVVRTPAKWRARDLSATPGYWPQTWTSLSQVTTVGYSAFSLAVAGVLVRGDAERLQVRMRQTPPVARCASHPPKRAERRRGAGGRCRCYWRAGAPEGPARARSRGAAPTARQVAGAGIARRGEPGGLRRSGYSSPQVDGFAGHRSAGGAPSTVFSAAIPPRAAPAMPPTIAPGGPPTIAPVTSPAMAPAIAPPNAASR